MTLHRTIVQGTRYTTSASSPRICLSRRNTTALFACRKIIPQLSAPTIRAMASASNDRYKLIFFTPPQDLPKIKEAIFAAGAGRFNNYTECGFTSPGVGQFRPGDAANPHIGERGKVEEVGEVKFETVCSGRDVTKEVVAALKRTHPYEEPAYEVYKLEDF